MLDQVISGEYLLALQQHAELEGKKIVVGGIVANSRGEILVQKRAVHKKLFPNCWDLSAGGRLEEGETIWQALDREIQEETGWRLKRIVAGIEVFDWETEKEGAFVEYREMDFLVEVEGDLEHPVLEVESFSEARWIGVEEIDILKENRQDVLEEDSIYRLISKAFKLLN